MAMQMQVSRPETAGVALALPEIVSCIVWHAAGFSRRARECKILPSDGRTGSGARSTRVVRESWLESAGTFLA
jgi:hypothetical protein